MKSQGDEKSKTNTQSNTGITFNEKGPKAAPYIEAYETSPSVKKHETSGVDNGATIVKKDSYRSDTYVFIIFGIALIFLISLGVIYDGIDFIPNDIEILDLDDNTTKLDVIAGDKFFFDITIPPRQSVAIFITDSFNEELDAFVDTTMTILKRPNTIIDFNDDVALGNPNPIVYFFLDQDEPEDFVVLIEILENAGNYTINTETIVNEIIPDIVVEAEILADEFFLATFTNFVVGQTYDITAYRRPNEVLDYIYIFEQEVEADTAIRIRQLDGTEIIEVFLATLAEFTGKVLFTPPSNGTFIIEIKGFDRSENNLFVLARSVETQIIDIQNNNEDETFFLHTQISTTVEFDIIEGRQYDIDIFLELDEEFELDFKNLFGYTYYQNGDTFLDTYTNESIPGVSLRVYDKLTNEIIVRDRSAIEVVEKTEPAEYYYNYKIYFYNVATFNSTELFTRFTIEGLRTTTVLVDISRFDLDFLFYNVDDINDEFLFGNFTLVVTESDFEPIDNSDQVDPTNLFPECDIDDTKYTIDDGSCEQGIALYCRHQIAPSNNLAEASLEDFSRVCDCANLLCATLQSGSDLDLALKVIFDVFYVIFLIIGLLGMIIYLAAHLELFVNGGFNYWVTHNDGFPTWTITFFFFLTTNVFYITKMLLAREIRVMVDISNNFNLSSIPIASEEFTYQYYYAIREEILGNGLYGGQRYAYNEDGDFLENQAADIANNARSFESLQQIIGLNLFCSVLKDVLAIVVFLDVSTVWISATSEKKLNPIQAERQERQFKRAIRFVEISYLLLLLILLGGVVASNGETYNFAPNILTFLTSLLVIGVYFFSRQRVAKRFSESYLLTDQDNRKVWQTVRNVSSVVIIANAGVIVIQLYSIIEVQDFDDLVDSSNNSIAQILFIFQDICIFAGVCAILYYILQQFQTFRNSLFSEQEEFESTINSDTLGESTNQITTKKVRTQIPQSLYSANTDK